MAVDIKYLNKFLLPMFDDQTQPLINQLFESFEKEPAAAYSKCVQGFHHWLSQPDERSTAVVNGLFLGIMLSSLHERAEFKEMFDKCMAYNGKQKGENVVNIFVRQVDKR